MKPGELNLRDLDALRGAAAVYVLIGHSRWLLWAGHAAWVSQPHPQWESLLAYGSGAFIFGREAVMVFFVLSGFFIHLRAAADLRNETPVRQSASRFYGRRAHRLVAPYVFALAATVVLDLAGRSWFPQLYLGHTGDRLLDANFANTGYSWSSVVPALLVLPSSLGRDFGTNGPLWSLAFETCYYAFYPAWLALRRRHAGAAFVGLPLLCLALSLGPGISFVADVLMHYPIWLAGAALAERAPSLRSSGRLVLAAVAVFALGMLLRVWSDAPLLRAVSAIFFGSGAVVAVIALPASWRPARLLAAFEFLGVRSYSIYILHFPLLVLLSAWLIQSQGARPLHGWFAAAGAVAAVGFACACFEICERRFLHPRLRLSPVDA